MMIFYQALHAKWSPFGRREFLMVLQGCFNQCFRGCLFPSIFIRSTGRYDNRYFEIGLRIFFCTFVDHYLIQLFRTLVFYEEQEGISKYDGFYLKERVNGFEHDDI